MCVKPPTVRTRMVTLLLNSQGLRQCNITIIKEKTHGTAFADNTLVMMISYRKFFPLANIIAAICILLIARPCDAQRAVIEGATNLGTGASLGTGNGTTVVLMTPLYIDAAVIFYNSELPKIEYVVAIQAELTGRVSVGVVPQLRLTGEKKKWMLYSLVGIPAVVAPFVMLGAEVGCGMLWRIIPKVGVYAEVVVDLYFIGNDLQDDGMLTQLNLNIGARIPF